MHAAQLLDLEASPPGASGQGLKGTRLQLVLGQLRAQVAAARLQRLGPPASLIVDRMLATSVRAARHRERVLPAGQMGSQLSRGGVELGPQTLGHSLIEPWLPRVFGDARAQIRDPLADRAVLRVVADAAAMAHREGVLPGGDKRLKLRAQGI